MPGSQVEVNDIKNSFERGRCGVIISSLCPEEARMGVNACLRASGAGAACINISSQLHLQRLHLGSSKSAKVGVFTPQKLANTKTFDLFLFPAKELAVEHLPAHMGDFLWWALQWLLGKRALESLCKSVKAAVF